MFEYAEADDPKDYIENKFNLVEHVQKNITKDSKEKLVSENTEPSFLVFLLTTSNLESLVQIKFCTILKFFIHTHPMVNHLIHQSFKCVFRFPSKCSS